MIIPQQPAQSFAALKRAVAAGVGTSREQQEPFLQFKFFGQGGPPPEEALWKTILHARATSRDRVKIHASTRTLSLLKKSGGRACPFCIKKLRHRVVVRLIARFRKMAEIAKRIELYNLAYRLASKYIIEEHKFRRPDIPRLLHDSIMSQMREGANEAAFIASKALEGIELVLAGRDDR